MASFRSLLGSVFIIFFIIYQYYLRAFRAKRFMFQGRAYDYFYHAYNRTWLNERAVEIPIMQEIVRQQAGKRILEVGNVLQHYSRIRHDVVDKYESAPGVINKDIVSFRPKGKYDLIISISTLEHVGWDEVPKDRAKIPAAVRNMVSLLSPKGRIAITVPLGQNPWLDKLILQNKFGLSHACYMKRISGTNEWAETNVLKWSPPKRYKQSAMQNTRLLDIRSQLARVFTPSDTQVFCVGFIEKK